MPLSKYFKPKFSYDLIRVGKNNDGGYLIDTHSFKKAENLVSLGISDDWSFEKDFYFRRKKINVRCFDDRLDIKFLIKNVLIHFIFIFYNKNFKHFMESVVKFFSYIRLKNIFLFKKKKISYGDLDKILKKSNNTFLKIDIESGEYRILKDILLNQNRIIGLIIEFHDIDLHRDKIISFILSLKLTLVHVHGNNYSDRGSNGDPTAIEMSFGKFPIKRGKLKFLPNKFDMPNNKYKNEINLQFKN